MITRRPVVPMQMPRVSTAARLAAVLVDAAPVALRSQLSTVVDLEAQVVALVTAGERSWPALPVDPEQFVAHCARRLAVDRSVDDALAALHSADLYLACACACGQSAAVAALLERYALEIRAAIARSAPAHLVDDISQRVYEKLFVGEDQAISRYGGRGKLSAWLRTLASREARSALRGRRARPRELDVLVARALPSRDPHLCALRAAYTHHFKSAFERAFELLSPRDRNVLRLAYVEGLSLEQLAALHGVGRSTAGRWRQSARDALLRHTWSAFASELDLSQSALCYAMDLIRSHCELSLARVIGGED